MSYRLVAFLAFAFIGATLVARALEGAYFSNTDIAIMNDLTVFRSVEFLGLFSVPAPNLDFFTEAVPHLVMWDYPFFGGTYEIFKFFLYALSSAAVFAFFMVVVGVLNRRFGA